MYGGSGVLRFGSVLDPNEVSNQGRIEIWKTSIQSIQEKPILGVGLSNFIYILEDPLAHKLTGSSAHNIYLHIAATTGVPSMVVFILILYYVFKKGIVSVRQNSRSLKSGFLLAVAFSVVWASAYLMTDAILFDGRVLLGFMVMMGLALGVYHSTYIQKNIQNEQTS